MSELIDLIVIALSSQVNVQRQDAEQRIVAIKEQNLDLFFATLSDAFVASNQKQYCGVILKRCIDLDWQRLQIQTKEQVKKASLSLLISPDIALKKAAANCIASICSIELPRNEWVDIIPLLVQNTTNNDENVRKASILTLGQICEALKNRKQVLPKEEAERILYGICQGFEKGDLEMQKLAIKALQDSFYFQTNQLAGGVVRDFVTEILFNNLPNLQLTELILQALIDYTKTILLDISDENFHPDFKKQFIQLLWVKTQPYIPNQIFGIPAMEIWQSLLQELIDRNSRVRIAGKIDLAEKIDNNIWAQMQESITNNLFINDDVDDYENDLNTLQGSAYRAISSIVEALGTRTHDQMLKFISANIQGQEWQKRKAGLLAFSALVETKKHQQVGQICSQAVTSIVTLLQDQNKRVSIQAAKVLERMAENYPEAILLNQQQLTFMEFIVNMLKGDKKITNLGLTILLWLTDSFSKFESPIKQNIEQLIIQFLMVQQRQDITQEDYPLMDLAFTCVLNCIRGLGKDQNITKTYIQKFGQEFAFQVQQPSNWKQQKQVNDLISAIHQCVNRLVGHECDLAVVNYCYNLVTGYFMHTNQITPEGMSLIGSLALYAQKQFVPFAQQYQNIIDKALQQQNYPELFKQTVLCIADIARALQELFKPYIHYLDRLLELVQQNIQREIKLAMFTTIADIALVLGSDTQNYYTRIMDLILGGFRAGIQLVQINDPSQQEYAEELNETMASCYLCVLHAYNGPDKPFILMFGTYEYLIQFVLTTIDESLNPTLDYLKLCLSVILDFIRYYAPLQQAHERILQILNLQKIRNLIEIFQKFKSEPDVLEMLTYGSQVYKTFGIDLMIY